MVQQLLRLRPDLQQRGEQQQEQQQEEQQEQQQQQEQQEQEQETPEPPPADLRLVRIGVEPSPLRNGLPAALTVLLHNDSPRVVSGAIVVEVVHDRATAFPRPPLREVYYLEPDTLEEISFELPAVSIGASPYTFFASVEISGEASEVYLGNNATWERVPVCEGPNVVEVVDGVDNDCNGMIDEGLGLPAAPGEALRMLRALQRQAVLDDVPLIFATPRLFAPFAREHDVLFASEEGPFIGLRDGTRAELSADLGEGAPGALLQLVDWNGGELQHGDLVSLRARGEYVLAEGGGGGRLVTRPRYFDRERVFSLVRVGDPDPVTGAPVDRRIRDGDAVALISATGRFLSAEGGGGGRLRIDRTIAAGWETFAITLPGGRP